MESFKFVGRWWNDKSIQLVKVEGSVYALNGWNGETFIDCWKCTGEHYMDASEEKYGLTPIVEYNEFNDMKLIGYEIERR